MPLHLVVTNYITPNLGVNIDLIYNECVLLKKKLHRVKYLLLLCNIFAPLLVMILNYDFVYDCVKLPLAKYHTT